MTFCDRLNTRETSRPSLVAFDPTGQRIISAGYVQARNVANSIASGRFVAK